MRRFWDQRLRGNGSLYVCSQRGIRLAGEGGTRDVHSSQLEYSSAASAPLLTTNLNSTSCSTKVNQITLRRPRCDTRRIRQDPVGPPFLSLCINITALRNPRVSNSSLPQLWPRRMIRL